MDDPAVVLQTAVPTGSGTPSSEWAKVSPCVPVIPQRTDCKAVVSVLPGQILGPEGFQLSVSLSTVHLPRMWVEKHPDKDSQVCV